MTIHSRNKGKVGEREAVNVVCKEMWGCKDAARTSQRRGDQTPDVDIGLPIHVEVKRRKKIASTAFLMQAERDAAKEHIPIVLMREDNGKWQLVVRPENLESLANVLFRQRKNNDNTD